MKPVHGNGWWPFDTPWTKSKRAPLPPTHGQYTTPAAAPAGAVQDTAARAYPEAGVRMRSAFLDSVLRHTPRVFEQEAWVVELPRSGEMATLQFFVLYRREQKVLVKKYHWGWSDTRWHAGNAAPGSPLTVRQLQSSSRCDGYGANGEGMRWSS